MSILSSVQSTLTNISNSINSLSSGASNNTFGPSSKLTSFTTQSTVFQAITFDIRDSNDAQVMGWTHDQPNPRLDQLPVAISGTSLTLMIYPEEIERTQPTKSTVNPVVTVDSSLQPQSWVDVWGADVPSWTLRGHTGYYTRTLNSYDIDGYMMFAALYNFFDNYYKENLYRLKNKQPMVRILFTNWGETYQDLWYVEPKSLPTKSRNNSKPLYFFYSLDFVGVKNFVSGTPVLDTITDSVSDYSAMLTKSAEALINGSDSLSALGGLIPTSLSNAFNSLLSNINTVTSIISQPLTIANTALTLVNNTLTQVNNMEKSLLNAVVSPLDPLFNVLATLKGIKCQLQTISNMPLNYYNNLSSNFTSLINSLHSSCGVAMTANSTKATGLLGLLK